MGAVESRHGECERVEVRAGDIDRAGDDDRDAYDAMRDRKDKGDVGDDLGLRYMVVRVAVNSVDATGIGKQGGRGLVPGEEASDAA